MTDSSRGQMQTLNLQEKLAQFTSLWSPRVVAECNEYQLKLAKVQGEFIWHAHPETDEVFYVLAGVLTLEFRDRKAVLHPGELLVVPKNVEHRSSADEECHILLIEPRGVANTGDAGGELSAPNNVWV